MLFDKKREYQTLLNKTTITLENLEKMKVDTREFYRILESATTNQSTLVSVQVEKKIDYNSRIKILKDLQKDLAKYELIYKINASINYLNSFIKEGVNKSNISKCVDEILTSLKILKSIDITLIKEFDEIFDNFYECTYNVIKLEFIYKESSNVLNFILKDKTHILAINNLIKSDISNLTNAINDIPYLNKLKVSLFETEKSGIDKNYVNAEVFKTLVLCTDTDKVKEKVIKDLESKVEQIEENISKIIKNMEKKTESWRNIRRAKDNISDSFKDLRRRIIALILSGGITTSIYIGLFSDLKEYSNKYSTTTTVYSSEEDIPQVSTELSSKLDSEFNVELKIFNKVTDDGLGTKSLYDYTYNVTDYIDEDFDYSTLLNVDELEIPVSDKNRTEKLGWNKEKLDTIPTFQYTVTTQDTSDFEFNQEEYEKNLFYSYLFTAFCYLGINLTVLKTQKAIGDLKDISENKKKRIKEIEKANDLVSKIEKLFKSNEKLKSEFESILNKKGFLLDEEQKEALNTNFREYYNQNKSLKKTFNSSYGDLDK